MRLEIKEHPRQGFVEAIYSGIVDLEGMRAVLDELRRVPGYAEGLNALWDLRKADLSAFAVEDMNALLTYMEQTPKRRDVRIALLVSGEAEIILLRLWRAVSRNRYGQTTQILTDRDAAFRWLGEAS